MHAIGIFFITFLLFIYREGSVYIIFYFAFCWMLLLLLLIFYKMLLTFIFLSLSIELELSLCNVWALRTMFFISTYLYAPKCILTALRTMDASCELNLFEASVKKACFFDNKGTFFDLQLFKFNLNVLSWELKLEREFVSGSLRFIILMEWCFFADNPDAEFRLS